MALRIDIHLPYSRIFERRHGAYGESSEIIDAISELGLKTQVEKG